MTKPRRQWKRESMEKAIQDILDEKYGYLKASKVHGVPRITLIDYMKKVRAGESIQNLLSKSLGRRTVLSAELEAELVKYALEMERRYFGLTLRDLKRMAYQLAVKNKVKHPFSTLSKQAGRKWFRLFVKRHPEITLRRPQPLSIARAKGFTKENVDKFYSLLKVELEKIKFNPERVYNVDETGITIVQHKSERVVALKGKREVHKLSSAERGKLVTVVTCMNAFGHFIPPLMVFPRERLNADILNELPPGVIAKCHKSGWIQTHLFTQWFVEFIEKVKPSSENPVLLLLDGHHSHTRNIDILDLARANSVSILCLPPHCTDKLQPLDVSFMMPFKTFYASEVQKWVDHHDGRALTHIQIAKVMFKAYSRACTMEISLSGFRKTGIMPFNPNRFTDADFIAKTLQSQDDEEEQVEEENLSVEIPSPAADETSALNQTPSVSSGRNSAAITPEDLRPVPTITVQPSTDKRTGKTCILTASPYKTELQESLARVQRRNLQKDERNTKRVKKTAPSSLNAGISEKTTAQIKRGRKKKQAEVTTVDHVDLNQPSTSMVSTPKPIKTKNTTKTRLTRTVPIKNELTKAKSMKTTGPPRKKKPNLQKTTRNLVFSSDSGSESSSEENIEYASSNESEEDYECSFCHKSWGSDNHGEEWIQCTKCFRWAHEECDPSVYENSVYKCLFCLNRE